MAEWRRHGDGSTVLCPGVGCSGVECPGVGSSGLRSCGLDYLSQTQSGSWPLEYCLQRRSGGRGETGQSGRRGEWPVEPAER